MFGLVKTLLKRNPVTHQLAKRLRNAVYPACQLQELATLWGGTIEEELDLPSAYAIFQRSRQLQNRLAARMPASNPPTRYLREQWCKHIGHLSLLDIYTKIGMLGWRPPQRTVLLAPDAMVANRFYLDLFRPYVDVVSDPAALRELWHESLVLEDHIFIMEIQGQILWLPYAWAAVQKAWSEQSRPPLLTLDAETIARGRRALGALGMPQDAWFVGLHVREAGFRQRDQKYAPRDVVRDADIHSYVPAIQEITARGGWVVRCGDASMKPLPALPHTIDYARSGVKADWLDIFLAAQSRFFIGTESGFSHVPATFGVPTLYTNWASWGKPPASATDYFLPKLYWSDDTQRYLSLTEILGSDLGICSYQDHFARRKVRVIDNTPEQIRNAVVELMEELQSGSRCAVHPRAQQIAAAYRAHNLTFNGCLMPGFIECHPQIFSSTN